MIIRTASNLQSEKPIYEGSTFTIIQEEIKSIDRMEISTESQIAWTTTRHLKADVIGGIQSMLPNTKTQADSTTSKHIFQVIVEPIPCRN